MQLFILDLDPERVPEMLCDAHVRKMCLETAQILSSVIRRQGKKLPPGVPKPYNPNHPVITALDTAQKINWTIRFNTALQREYSRRFGKNHAYSGLTGIYHAVLFRPGTRIDPAGWTFARDFKDVEITEPDIVLAYREYYRHKKKILRRWHYTGTGEPDWMKVSTNPNSRI